MNSPAAPCVLPAIQNESAVVIFLHHIGASGLAWAKRFESMRLPHVRYVFPNAPIRQFSLYDGNPVTAWYDVHGFSNIAPVDEETLFPATKKLHQLLDDEISRGTPSERIILAGYSLGGCLALHGCVTYNKQLAGCVVMNCWLADYRDGCSKRFHLANKNTPFLQMHGDTDPLIHLKYAKLSADKCKEMCTRYNYKVYRNASHWPTNEMFENMKKFISEHLPALDEGSDECSDGSS